MQFEWDEAKPQSNLLKHGVDFLDVAPLFSQAHLTKTDGRNDYGEERWRAVGIVGNDCFEVVFTQRSDAIRLIAAWKGGKGVRRDYQAILAGRDPGDAGTG